MIDLTGGLIDVLFTILITALPFLSRISMIMIAIITYTSVIEWTRNGILKLKGSSKRKTLPSVWCEMVI